MRTKLKVSTAIILVVLVMTFCRKYTSDPKVSVGEIKKETISPAKLLHRQPKRYDDATNEQVTNSVQKFKSSTKKNSDENFQARFNLIDSIPCDSAVWLIEAALNYDFDINLNGAYTKWRTDTLIYNIPINNVTSKVGSGDLENLFTVINSSLTDSLGSNYKIKYINVEGFNDPANPNNTVYFGLTIVKYQLTTTISENCSGGTFWSGDLYLTMDINSFNVFFTGGQCQPTNSNMVMESSTNLNFFKNCRGAAIVCPNPSQRGYFYNIYTSPPFAYSGWGGSLGQAGNLYPAAFYNSGFHSTTLFPNWYCINQNKFVNGTQLTAYLAAQVSLANGSALPNYFVTERLILADVGVGPALDPSTNSYVSGVSVNWRMLVTYGQFGCITNQ